MIVKILKTQLRDRNVQWDPKSFDKNRFPVVEEDCLLIKLNSVIEWEWVNWPLDYSQPDNPTPITNYLGDTPELKPGDSFSIGEAGNLQIFRVIDNNTIGLIHTETGGLALSRFINEILKPEINMLYNINLQSNAAKICIVDSIPPTYTVEYKIPYNLYKIWHDKFLLGRDQWEQNKKYIKIEMDTDLSIFPITCFMLKNSIKFESNIELDLAKILTEDILAWFYNNYPRVKVIESKTVDEVSKQIENTNSKISSFASSNSGTTNLSMSNDTSDSELNEDFGEFDKDEKYYYSCKVTGGGEIILYLVKKSFWENEGHMDDQHLDTRFEEMYLNDYFDNCCEGTYSPKDDTKTLDDVLNHISKINVFEFNLEFNDFIKDCD